MLSIQILFILPKIYLNIQNTDLWITALRDVINSIKRPIYYYPTHPLSIMTDDTTYGSIKLMYFKVYFNLMPTYI